MSIKPVLVPDHDAAALRKLMDSFAEATTGPTRQQLAESRAAVAAAQGVAEQQVDELSVHKMLKYSDAAEKDRDSLNQKWDDRTASEKEKERVLRHEEGEQRAADKIKQKTGKLPVQIGKLDRLKHAITREGVAEGSIGSGYGSVFTLHVNTGEKPTTKTKTKKFKREDDAVLWAEDYADQHEMFPNLKMEIQDEDGNVVWELEESQGVAEGLKDTIKKGVKNIKRGMQGWNDSDLAITGTENKPRDVANRAKNLSDKDLKDVHRAVNAPGVGIFGKGEYKNPAKHSPAGLQKHVLDREIRKRGLEEQGVKKDLSEALAQGNYDVGLEDIGEPVLVNGKEGYILLHIERHGGSGKLVAKVLQPDFGAKGYHDLDTISRVQQGVAEGTESEQEELAKKIRELLAAGKDREANHLRHKLNNLRDRKRDKHDRQQGVAEDWATDAKKLGYKIKSTSDGQHAYRHSSDKVSHVGTNNKNVSWLYHPDESGNSIKKDYNQDVTEGSVARGDLYNVVIEYFNGGKGHRNAMALRKKAESGMSAKNLAVLLNDFSKKKWGSTLNGSDAIDAVKNIVYPYDFDQGVAEAYDFKGGFPFDVDHMPGAVYRGGDSPVQSAKKKYSDHQQWEAAVNKMNSRQYDDSSEYTSDSKGQQVTADGHTWAAWNDTKGFGWIEAADMAEGSENFTITHKKDQTWPGSIQVLVTNKNTGDWKVIAGDPKKIRQQLKHEFGIDYNFDQQDMLEGVAEGKKRSDRYHIVGKDGNPASLASYADQASAVKDRDAKHPGAEVRQVGPRGKIKGVAEGSKVKTPKGYGDIVQPQKLKTIAKADLGKNELNLPAGYGDIVQPQKYKTITKAKGVAEGNPDVMRHTGDKTVKVVKRGGKPVGEIGIDSGPEGNGDYYVKLYDGSYDAAGFSTAEEALAELKYAIKSAGSGPDTSFGGPGGWTGPVEEQQVDELSPKTLGSYIKKSSADAATRQGEVSGRNQFGKGAEFAVKAFYGDKIQPHPQRNDPKIAKRQAGVDQAVDRLTAEDMAESRDPVEQLRADIKRFAR
jgi:hypothetical protein